MLVKEHLYINFDSQFVWKRNNIMKGACVVWVGSGYQKTLSAKDEKTPP